MKRQRGAGAGRPLQAVLQALPSKSVTHRALVAAALAEGSSTLVGPLVADDTVATRDALVEMGVRVRSSAGRWIVDGCAGPVPGGGDSYLRESGTSLRLLLALAAQGRQPSRLDGASRLRERPLGDLVRALRELGAEIAPAGSDRLPLTAGGRALRGGRVRLPGSASSQYASALLLIAPLLPDGLDLLLEPPAVSLPYIELTTEVAACFGARVARPGRFHWRVEPGGYRAAEYSIEGDHSSASYPFAAAAILGGRVRIRGLRPASRQPDARFAAILGGLGCEVASGEDWVEVCGGDRIPGFDLRLTDAPDLVPTLAALALFADGACAIRGVAHLRHKESDRLELLARNLTRLGRPARPTDDSLEIDRPRGPLRGGRVATAGDHRIAMAFATAGLRLPGVEIDAPGCVSKSNPAFWSQLDLLRARTPG